MPGSIFAALRHRDFTLYIGSSFLWTIAMQVQATALAWQIYEMTGDPFQLGLVGLMEFLPAALLALPAGHLADRRDRRRIILIGVVASWRRRPSWWCWRRWSACPCPPSCSWRSSSASPAPSPRRPRAP
jgi:MFS family permease